MSRYSRAGFWRKLSDGFGSVLVALGQIILSAVLICWAYSQKH